MDSGGITNVELSIKKVYSCWMFSLMVRANLVLCVNCDSLSFNVDELE